ncbi:MAG: pyridine nucleotide-disulfide oxidoreductase [Frankiales bacterium]|nr:pyridine nucleotide-disulfide oxidoreductase [Frankiales bacterium]
MAEAQEFDVIVIGLGPGGERVAGDCASAGLRVLGIESRLVGGECPYWGCVPSKMMIRAASTLAESRRVAQMSGDATDRPDWGHVARRIRDEATDDWDDAVAVKRLTDAGGHFVRGRGRIAGPGRVAVGEQEFRATTAIVIGTGTAPVVPPIPGLAGTPFWTNREAIETTEVPPTLVVLGGGAIGLELAQVFARFGSRVTILEAGPRVLGVEEPEAGDLLGEVLTRGGIDVRTGVRATGVSYDDSGFTVTLDGGATATGDKLLVAVGRKTDLGGLGVAALGLDGSARFLETDEHLRVMDGVYAVGDVTGKGLFTHVAVYQGGIAAAHLLGQGHPGADYAALPRVTFTDPEIGATGLTEKQARERGLAVRVGCADSSTSTRGWIHKAGNDGFIKLVVDASTGVLVGATSAGPWGGEVLGALSVAVHARLELEQLRHMIYAYPTFHRGIEDAIKAVGA